jgi:hypothetical protein
MHRLLLMGAALSCIVCSFETHARESCAASQCPFAKAQFELSTYSMDEITSLFPLLQEKVEAAFVKYPYLWVPPEGETYRPNRLLLTEENGLVTVLRKKGEVVAVAAGAPFDSAAVQGDLGSEVIEKARENGFDPSKMFYMCYFLAEPSCFNDTHLIGMIYRHFVAYAKELGKTQFCYLEACGSDDHPLKPDVLHPIEPWGNVIYGCESMNIKMDHTWPTLQVDGSVRDEAHTIEFFVKDFE